jgi:hypothetical protein
MPSESVAGFFDKAQASRVLFPEQVEQLIRQPDIPHSDLSALCEYLLARGVLTRFQADAIREGRGGELSYAGYPVIDDLGPAPGGRSYKALHPSLRTPVVLRRIAAGWLAPADTVTSYVGRARSFGMIAHPHLVHLLDAGTRGDEVYVVIEQPADAADLAALAREIGGAMPGFLAAEYGRALASALRSAHERGGAHGDVRPANMLVAPLAVKAGPDGKPRRRPAPDAVIRLAELGLVPLRQPGAEGVHPFLPPERLDNPTPDARGDIYGLGASLYFLLAGRPPFNPDDPELAAKIRTAPPLPLSSLRPDLPPDFVALVAKMLEKSPDARPATSYDVEAALIRFCRPGTVPPTPVAVPLAVPASAVAVAHPVADAAPLAEEEQPSEPADDWGVGANAFDMTALSQPSTPAEGQAPRQRRRQITDEERSRNWMLIILGGMLHLTAILLLVLWLTGAFESTPKADPTPEPKPIKKPDDGGRPVKKSRG